MMNESNNRVEILRQYLKDDPNDSFSQYALALEYAQQGNNQEAIILLEQLVSQNPDYLASYYQLGKLYETLGKTSEAIAYFEKGIEIAQKQKDQKTLNELRSALDMME